MFAIELAVVGSGDGVDLFVEHGDFVGFQTICQITGQRTFVEGLVFWGDDQEFKGSTCNGMVCGDTNTIADQRI